MRPGAIVMLAVLVAAGCVDAGTDLARPTPSPAALPGLSPASAAPTVPYPADGAQATYEGPGRTMTFTFLRTSINGTGFQGEAIRVKDVERRPVLGQSLFLEADDYVAAGGRRILTAAPCPGGGSHASSTYPVCAPGERASGSYWWQGLPAWYGLAGVWGRPLDRSFSIETLVAGRLVVIDYKVGPAGGDCVRFDMTTKGDVPVRSAILAELATAVTWCDAAPFPASFTLASAYAYMRTSQVEGNSPIDPAPLGATFWGRVLPDAEAGRFPPAPAAASGGMTVEEAVRTFMATPEGQLVKARDAWVVRLFAENGAGSGSALSIEATRSQDASLVLEEPGGRLTRANLSRSCEIILPCSWKVKDVTTSQDAPSFDPAFLPRSLPYRDLLATANATFGRDVNWSSVGTQETLIDPPRRGNGDFLAGFLTLAPGSMDPLLLTLQATDGTVIWMSAGWEPTMRALGLAPDALT